MKLAFTFLQLLFLVHIFVCRTGSPHIHSGPPAVWKLDRKVTETFFTFFIFSSSELLYVYQLIAFFSCFKHFCMNLNGNIVAQIREIAEMDYLAIWRVLIMSLSWQESCVKWWAQRSFVQISIFKRYLRQITEYCKDKVASDKTYAAK